MSVVEKGFRGSHSRGGGEKEKDPLGGGQRVTIGCARPEKEKAWWRTRAPVRRQPLIGKPAKCDWGREDFATKPRRAVNGRKEKKHGHRRRGKDQKDQRATWD